MARATHLAPFSDCGAEEGGAEQIPSKETCLSTTSTSQDQQAFFRPETPPGDGGTYAKEPAVTVPSIEFLGVILNSMGMIATLPCCRKEQIKVQDQSLLRSEVTLTDLASFIGLAVASDPAVDLAPIRHKYLEIVKNRELRRSHGNHQAKI
ncbi:hypothetical protein E2C01_069934 [Portunus trituberculatus]|uniref:Uncharacterized protein n=1 Tax=Portunus trituberculatus TaxID=210409 RepID=A0A5B7I445_PORTR|nr:hypothetical protein [Portunus trituberculatus]